MTPPFTRKDMRAASAKRPIDWSQLKNLPVRYNLALADVLKGDSSKSSRVDITTLFSFMLSAKQLGLIDDGGMICDVGALLADAHRRVQTGKPFRLDGRTSEVIKEMIGMFETIVRSISERDFMRVCNHSSSESGAT